MCKPKGPIIDIDPPAESKKKIKIKLRDGKEREIKHMISTSFWGADGKPISIEELETLQRVVDAEDSDLFDVLSYISFAIQPITRKERVSETRGLIFQNLDEKQKEFLDFVLSKYIEEGVEELDEEKLPQLLNLKYHAISDAEKILGGVEKIRLTFFAFQKNLYSNFL